MGSREMVKQADMPNDAILIEEVSQRKMIDNDNSAEWLRSFEGCDHYTDEQLTSIVQTLDTLANILFDFTCEKNGIIIDNQLAIPLQTENQDPKKAA